MQTKTETAGVSTAVRKIVYSGLLTALGVILPQAFHVFGQNAGMVFLPIQIPILMAGILTGPYYGGAVGVLVPVLSALITGMPPVPKVYFMLFELAAYGLSVGLLLRRWNVYISLIGAMIAGRVCYGAALAFGVYVLGFTAPFAGTAAFTAGIVTGIPGMAIQIIIIPLLYKALKKGGFTFEK